MNDTFRQTYTELGEAEKQAMAELKAKAQELHDLLMKLSQDREVAIAKTKLEESIMWAVKSITAPKPQAQTPAQPETQTQPEPQAPGVSEQPTQ